MIDGSEKPNGWLNFELQSPHVERRSNLILVCVLQRQTLFDDFFFVVCCMFEISARYSFLNIL